MWVFLRLLPTCSHSLACVAIHLPTSTYPFFYLPTYLHLFTHPCPSIQPLFYIHPSSSNHPFSHQSPTSLYLSTLIHPLVLPTSIYLPTSPPTSVQLSMHLEQTVSIHPPTHLSAYICPSIQQPIHLLTIFIHSSLAHIHQPTHIHQNPPIPHLSIHSFHPSTYPQHHSLPLTLPSPLPH